MSIRQKPPYMHGQRMARAGSGRPTGLSAAKYGRILHGGGGACQSVVLYSLRKEALTYIISSSSSSSVENVGKGAEPLRLSGRSCGRGGRERGAGCAHPPHPRARRRVIQDFAFDGSCGFQQAGGTATATTASVISQGGLHLVDEPEDLLVLQDHLADLVVGVQDRGVVAPAEEVADVGQRVVGQFPGEIHRHLPRPGDVLAALGAGEVADRAREALADEGAISLRLMRRSLAEVE